MSPDMTRVRSPLGYLPSVIPGNPAWLGLLCVSPAREVASPAGRSIEARGESVPSLPCPWSRPTAPPWEPGLGRRPGGAVAVPAEAGGRRHVARLCLDVGVALLATAGRLVGLGLHVRQDVTRGRPPQAPSDKGLFDASGLPGASPRLPGLRCRRPGMAPAPAAGTPGRPSPCAWNCCSRAPVLKSSLFWRLRELVWVGGCVTARASWASPPGGNAGVYTDWPKRPLGAVLGHLCTLLRRGLGLWVALGSQ